MNLLAIDTSSHRSSIAWRSGSETIALTLPDHVRPSQGLFDLFQQLELAQRPVDRIIVGVGPGSFSGIRSGIAAAQAIALAKSAEIVGVCSAWSQALQKPNVTRLGIFADARRGERYLTIFAHGTLERPTVVIPNDTVEEHLSKLTEAISGDPLPLIPTTLPPRAADFLELPETGDHWIRTDPLEPIYLREAVAAGHS